VCPISALVATVDPDWERGADPPRPVVIDPPLDGEAAYEAGDELGFGITVFGSAARLLPYVVLALGDMGNAGLGRRYERDGFWSQGRFDVREVALTNAFSGKRQILFDADEGRERPLFRSPAAPITFNCTPFASADTVRLEFLTPTRLVHKGEVLPTFELLPFLQRLRERLEALDRRYGPHEQMPPERPEYPFDARELAAGVQVAENTTRWEDVRSYSRRQRQAVPVGGFTGSVVLHGQLAALMPFLAWGQITHVGKDATKGNGLYSIAATA
jgi:hypothetical protein